MTLGTDLGSNQLPAHTGEGSEELERMSLLEHLEELRSRLLHSVAALFIGFFVCFSFAEGIYKVLSLPVTGGTLAVPLPVFDDCSLSSIRDCSVSYALSEVATFPRLVEKLSFLRLQDPFILYVKVALLTSLFLMSPFLLFQVWRFVAPGLYRKEKRYALPFVFFGSSFFLAGGIFGYFVAFPFAAKFLINMGDQFEAVLTVDTYFGILVNILLGLGIMFELPIMIFMLSQLGVVTPRFLLKNFRWAVLIIFVVAAIITPTPDVVNLCVVALPTLVLYLIGVGAAAIAQWRKK